MLTDTEILCFSGYYLVRGGRPLTAVEGEEKVQVHVPYIRLYCRVNTSDG